MDLQTLTFLFVGVTFAIYIGIAFWARAGSTKEFYVAGGGIHPVANGMATAADWMSAASFISMAGLIAFYGYGGSVFLMGWTGGYVLLAMLLAPYLRKHGAFTVPEFISDRYYSKTARVVAVICLIIASVTYVIGQMKGIGVAFSRFLEVDYETGLVSGMVIVAFYATMGGMKGITYTQIAQYVIMIIAYTIPAIFISFMLTGNPIPQLGLGSEMADGTYLLDKLDQVVTQLGFAEYTTQARLSTTNMFVYTLSLMIGTAGLPHVIMRFFTVSSVKAARESAGWALVFIALLYTTAPAVAAMARLNLMQTIDQPNAEQNLAYADRPSWFKNWETTGLLKFEDKNNDGLISYTGDKKTNEMVKVDRDIMVLANPEIAGLPNWVIAIVAAGGLAAALSTAAGLLLAIASSISHDLLKGVWRPNITEKEELRYSRISMIGAILIAGYYGFNPPDFAAGTVALAFGLAASSIFPALMMGIFSKKMNKEGAIAGIITGISSGLFYLLWVYPKFSNAIWGVTNTPILGIDHLRFGLIGAPICLVVMVVVSLMTKEPSPATQKMVDDTRIPTGKPILGKQ